MRHRRAYSPHRRSRMPEKRPRGARAAGRSTQLTHFPLVSAFCPLYYTAQKTGGGAHKSRPIFCLFRPGGPIRAPHASEQGRVGWALPTTPRGGVFVGWALPTTPAAACRSEPSRRAATTAGPTASVRSRQKCIRASRPCLKPQFSILHSQFYIPSYPPLAARGVPWCTMAERRA